MQMDSMYQPESAVSTEKDRVDHPLASVHITHIPQPGVDDGIDVAMASNGFLAVAVPVTLEEGDVLGLVPAQAFKHARKLAKRGQPLSMVLLAEVVRLSDGTEYPRPTGSTPDIMRCAPDTSTLAERAEPTNLFAINPQLMATAAKAMGADALVHAGRTLARHENRRQAQPAA